MWPLLSWARAAFAVHLRNLQDFKSQQLLDLRSCRKGMDRNDKIPAAAWKEVIFWGIKNKRSLIWKLLPGNCPQGMRKDIGVKL